MKKRPGMCGRVAANVKPSSMRTDRVTSLPFPWARKEKKMIVTEDLAKTKWCPLLRFEIGPVNSSAWQGVAYTNRGEELKPPEACCCIASDCMMWVIHYRDGKALGYCGLVKQ